MKILLVNVDSRFNLAIRRMYNYFKKDNEVEMIDLGLDGYPNRKKITVNAQGYDKVYSSNIFEINQDRFEIIGCDDITYGGIGSINPSLQLPKEIEKTEPYYYDHEDTSYGFITRGCIRNCWFCKVPKYEGKLKVYNSLESIIKHKKVKFLDNNILAYKEHMDVFRYLIDKKIRCEFNQGLDFRLINEENAEALSKLNYMGEYIFAFDDPKYEPLLEKQLKIIKKYISKDWKLKFYIYQAKDMDISQLIRRVEWCRANKCLPYVMRDINCWDSKEKNFYIDYAAYCNQPSFFKKMNFETFLYKRHKGQERINETLGIYNKYSAMI
ncbi:MAG: Radical SAM protein [uncultured Clostridium sp.]